MNNRIIATVSTATAVLVLLATAACDSSSNATEAPTSNGGPISVIVGAGSTFVEPLMATWVSGYQQAHKGMIVNYQGGGSGKGIVEFKQGMLQFAASDAPLSDDEVKGLAPMLQIPGTAGPVCIVYNLPSVERPLRFSPKTLAGIFLGTVISWQDPSITQDNPGVALPRAAVIPVHRSDGSGTTSILTAYLSKISPEWSSKAGHGVSVTWPAGLGVDGSQSILNTVKQTPGTIGYLELHYAKEGGAKVASIQNRAGTFVEPTPNSAMAAIEAFQGDLTRDIRSPIVDPPASARDAYPISGFTFLMMYKDRVRVDEQVAVKDFVTYVLSTGQETVEQMSYAKLPQFVQQQAEGFLAQLTADGKPLK